MNSNDTPFVHRVARPAKPTEPEPVRARPETIMPFAHTAAKKPVKYVLEPMPLCDDDLTCEEELDGYTPAPLTDDDLGEEAPRSVAAKNTAPAKGAAGPWTAPVPQESSAMRQTLVAVVAFIATTLVLLLAVVVWKTVFGK